MPKTGKPPIISSFIGSISPRSTSSLDCVVLSPDIKEEFNRKVEEIKKELDNLDKEKALKTAKKKGEELKVKADELLDLAKNKGNDVLEEIAKDLKTKTVKVAKEVVKKLEEE